MSVRHVAVAALAAAVALPLVAAPAATAATGQGAVVSRADIDGDGRPDTTTLRSSRDGTRQTLTVKTAAGRTSSATINTPYLFDRTPFHGVAEIDGAAGHEIVINTGSGAHTLFFAVYSWRDGKLVAQTDPASGSTEWVTDSALSASQGYRVQTVRGVRQLTSVALARDTWGRNATFSGTRVTAQWRDGRWMTITRRAVTVPADSPTVAASAGWHVTGLAR
ncbi:MAG: hypothetical protein Q4G43_17405 [Mobilicoccus sp.]|nr:hypothetical protein [Mobilicoccus sp.]